jgi:hypothetical protein
MTEERRQFMSIWKEGAGTRGCLGRIARLGVALAAITFVLAVSSLPAQQSAAQSGITRTLGTIQAISGNNITLATQAGTISVTVQDGTRVLRVEPGEKDLKNATPMQLQDLVAGDRVLVFGRASKDGKTFAAGTIVAMKKAAIEAKQKQDEEDWQKRGVGGLVSAVDPANGTVTISVASLGGTKTLLVQTTKDTIIRRYAPDSVKFDDAKPGKLGEIKPGDQLRARGTRSADGATFAAEEIVSGAFRNIAGTIVSLDPSANTMTVMDLVAKKPLTVKMTTASEVRKLPVMMAQFMAARLKGNPGGGAEGAAQHREGPGNSETGKQASVPGNSERPAGEEGRSGPGSGGFARRGGGTPDFQQMISRMPPASLSDFQKGDAVMIVSTEGTDSGVVTAITVLGGVEPILAATPKGGQPMTLSPWSLGGGEGAGDAGDNPNQ